MIVRDIMTKDVVTVSSNASIIKAKRLMQVGKFRRLPVVEKERLVGLITAERLEKAVPSDANYGGVWDLANGLGTLSRTPVKRIMQTNVVTATPNMTVEEAVASAQANKVGALVVVKGNDEIAGILTTNDFFYRIVNKVLGVGEPGNRIWVAGGGEGKAMEEIISTINRQGLEIITLHIIAPPEATKKDIIVHINSHDASQLVDELKSKGYKVEMRKR